MRKRDGQRDTHTNRKVREREREVYIEGRKGKNRSG